MANNLDLFLDGQAGGLISGGSFTTGSLPALTRNDAVNVRLRLMERDGSGVARDVDVSSTTFTFALGKVDQAPVDGAFKLTTSTGTSQEIPYNATTTQVLNAVSAVAGNVTVATYGSSGSAWLITAATLSTALSFTGVSFTLFPSSRVSIANRSPQVTGGKASQVVSLLREPAASTSSFAAASTANVVTLSLLQNGATSPAANEAYKLTVGNDVMGGSIALSFDGNATGAVAYNATPFALQTALAAVTGIGSGNISVTTAGASYVITFVGALGAQNITTALLLDAGGIQYIPYREAVVTLNTAALDQLFVEAGTNTIAPSLEIQVVQGGSTRTLVQSDITVRKDVIL